jgi:preprotein translocase subunit YajC
MAARLARSSHHRCEPTGKEFLAMSLKMGDKVRTSSGQIGSVVSIDADRTIVVMFEDYGARFQPSELQVIGTDTATAADSR